MQYKTCLVTGGSGFLGSHLIRRLLDEKTEVIVLDVAPFPEIDLISKVNFCQGDVRDRFLIDRLVGRVDAVIHCAAALPLWSKRDIYTTNIDGTKNVLDAAYQHNVMRVIFISSTAVYGIPMRHPIYEDDPVSGVGAYGKSKIAAERLCNEYRAKGLTISVIRPKTFIGTGRLGVFQILFEWVKEGRSVPVIGDGKNKYQLLAVSDLVDFIITILGSETKIANETYNVGAEIFGTVEEDLHELFAFANTSSSLRRTPPRLVKILLRFFEMLRLSPLYEWVYETADKDSFVSIERARKLAGWIPKISNAQALIESYNWYMRQWREYAYKHGIDHRSAWRQGILRIAKWFS